MRRELICKIILNSRQVSANEEAGHPRHPHEVNTFPFLKNLSISLSQVTRKSQIWGSATLSSILFCSALSAINQWDIKFYDSKRGSILGWEKAFPFELEILAKWKGPQCSLFAGLQGTRTTFCFRIEALSFRICFAGLLPMPFSKFSHSITYTLSGNFSFRRWR